jgi:CHAT domain-containing protein
LITERNGRILKLQHWLSLNPYTHPERYSYLLALVSAQLKNEEVDSVVLHLTEAILLPLLPPFKSPEGVPWCFLTLAKFLFIRFNRTREPKDLRYSIEYFRHLRNLDFPVETVGFSLSDVMTSLVVALGTHVELEPGSATQNIGEMVTLCRGLLPSEISGDRLADSIVALSRAVGLASEGSSMGDTLDEVVDYMREAINMYPPGCLRTSIALGETLTHRFIHKKSLGDFREAMALFDDIIAHRPLEEAGKYSEWHSALQFAAFLTRMRFLVYPNLENLEDAISRNRTALNYAFPGGKDHSAITDDLAGLVETRAEYFHLPADPQRATSQQFAHSSLQPTGTTKEGLVRWDNTRDLPEACSTEITGHQRIHRLESLLSNTVPGTSDQIMYLRELAGLYHAKFDRSGDILDLEKAIEWQQIELASTSDADSQMELRLLQLGTRFARAFELSRRTSFLEESISLLLHVLKMPGTQGEIHRLVHHRLSHSYLARWQLFHHGNDLDKALHSLQMCIDDEYTIPPQKLTYACYRASIARTTGHPSISAAYDTAMSCMQHSLVFAPTLHTQHAQLASVQVVNEMPLEYASYQVETGHLEQAIETLEQGRALLWSEMRGFRTSIDQLDAAYPVLASRLSAISQQLETLMTSIPPIGNGHTGVGVAQRDRLGEMDEISQLLRTRQMLLDERGMLISQIQQLPGFGNFLKAASFDTLRAAASRGPVVIINHCKYRSDILIVLHDSPPSLITTADDFYSKANKIANRLLDTRKKYLLESIQYQRALHSALKDLYELVGKPVVTKLHELNIPEQSRIWWCPTSVFCSLPLHAMGPTSSNDKFRKYFSDLYISSYTPTLSALIKSREPCVHSSDSPSLLIIAPPEGTLPGVREEIEVIKRVLTSSVDTTLLGDATSDTATECLQHHQFAHFACHGVLEGGKPFDAAFKLRGDNHLTLLDIVRSRLPAAEFALLSACHTAELTDGSIADEVLHLTAALQYCGFRSVVGTMWAMADTDGRDLAEYFYEFMFFGGDQNVTHYEWSAKALRDAVQKLRRVKRVSLERWVNFVHYGV